MDIKFVASVAVITTDPAASRKLYLGALGLPLKQVGGDYYASDDIGGCKHFGVWPLPEAAQSCFGSPQWPADVAVPQLSLEFELADEAAVAASADELKAQGFQLLHDAKTEPWGQTVARLLSPEGAIVGLSYAPWLHD
jgi:catechol 2,3-dioxygenase-like lactoylglutathione lyase family enzyme